MNIDPYYENMNQPKSRAVDNKALRDRRKDSGLVHYREYVTPEEKQKLIEFLDEMRNTPTKEL
jgi:hypothetical protein